MSILPYAEGMMPMQLLLEFAILFGGLIGLARLLERRGFRLNKLAQAIGSFAIVESYFLYRLYPPLPSSMLAIISVVTAIGIFGWVSSCEHYWQDCRRPILAVLDGKTPTMRLVRGMIVVLLPLLVGGWAVTLFMPPDPIEPVELRTYNPAPPFEITVYSPADFQR